MEARNKLTSPRRRNHFNEILNMDGISTVISAWLIVFLLFSLLWCVQWIRKEADIVDAGWAYGIGIVALYYASVVDGFPPRKWLVGTLAALWAFRLGSYLLLNRVLRSGEDGRYKSLRDKWGANAQRNFFIFFQAQGLLVVILTLPFLAIMSNPVPMFTLGEVVGAMIWTFAVGGEAVADAQLAAFRARPENRGRTCQEGLWRFSRHPNYFFEWLHWISYIFFAYGTGYGWLAVMSAALIFYLILFVTGIPPTEARALESRGEQYREYQRTTSAFLPWFRSGVR